MNTQVLIFYLCVLFNDKFHTTSKQTSKQQCIVHLILYYLSSGFYVQLLVNIET